MARDIADVASMEDGATSPSRTELRHRGLLSVISDLVFWTDSQGTILDYHALRVSELYLPPSHFVGQKMHDVIPAPAGVAIQECLKKTVLEGAEQVVEYDLPFPDGERHYEGRLAPCGGNEFVFFIRNITERWKLQEALRKSENQYRTVVERQTEIVCRSLPDTTLTFVNEAACRYFGKTIAELEGQKFFHFLSTAARRVVVESLREMMRTKKAVTTEHEVTSSSGEVRWQQWTNLPILNEAGQVVEFQGVGRDITDQKRAEIELRRREIEFQNLADNVPDVIMRLDRQLRYRYVNRALVALSGIPRADFVGRTSRELRFPRRVLERIEPAILKAFDSMAQVSLFVPVPVQDRSLHQFQLLIVPECSDSGRIDTVLCVARDLTDLKKAQEEVEQVNRTLEQRVQSRTEELQTLNRELAKVLRLKDEFLASMSHELRTPLNAILGMAQLLREQVYGPSGERVLRGAKLIEESGRHLLALISDILDVSKIRAGRLTLELATVWVKPLCEASVIMVEKAAEKKKQDIGYECHPDSVALVADGRRLKQMLVNLLSNAVKFTPEGGRIRLIATGDHVEGVVHFAVSDTGVGIAAEEIPNLFQPFVQLDSTLSKKHSGTGLGLSLVLSMATLHEGGVEVQSTPGAGSTFTISIPWRERVGTPNGEISRVQTEGKAQAEIPSGMVVLLAEDNEGNAEIAKDYLESLGMEVQIAWNGFEAIEKTRELQPDLVLMDIQMPGMDGLEAIRRIRAHEEFKQLPIIALTALAMPGDQERCLGAGASGYLTKPLDMKALRRMIAAALTRKVVVSPESR